MYSLISLVVEEERASKKRGSGTERTNGGGESEREKGRNRRPLSVADISLSTASERGELQNSRRYLL